MAVSSNQKKYHVPIINARRGYVYTGIYSKDNELLFDNSYIKLDEFMNSLNKLDDYKIISNDEEIELDKIEYNPNILEIVSYYKNKESINPHELNPNYLKKTAAEEAKDDNRDNEE